MVTRSGSYPESTANRCQEAALKMEDTEDQFRANWGPWLPDHPPWCRSDGAAPSCSWGDILQGGFPLLHKSTKNCTWRPPSPHNELLCLENYWTVHMAMLKKLYELSVVPWATNQLFPFILQGKVRRERMYQPPRESRLTNRRIYRSSFWKARIRRRRR